MGWKDNSKTSHLMSKTNLWKSLPAEGAERQRPGCLDSKDNIRFSEGEMNHSAGRMMRMKDKLRTPHPMRSGLQIEGS
jgi:hypothetical protein